MESTQFANNVPQDKQEFIRAFYATTDNRQALDEYVDFVTEDVDFIMGLKQVSSKQAVRQFRQGSWQGIATRKHVVHQVYTIDDECSQVMIHGTVSWGLENGKSVDNVGWAARMVFASEGSALKMSKYHVWVDASQLVAALKA
ncbi:hypothetical protein OIO90_000988 [Microbotryomycetes sp. JL221]|nr:hypothetical protein OIO90_000988 [Microbotryomycetes sp. JL221]